jgi:hypothetical protein
MTKLLYVSVSTMLALAVTSTVSSAVEWPVRCVLKGGGPALERFCEWEDGQILGECCPKGYLVTDYRPEGPPSDESSPPRRSGTPS